MDDRLATIDMGQRVGLLCPLFLGGGGGGGAGSPCDRMWPWPRPTSVPSGMLIHPTVWPENTNVTDRTDNGPMAQGEPFYKRSPRKSGDETPVSFVRRTLPRRRPLKKKNGRAMVGSIFSDG